LERRWRVSETERHHKELKVVVVRSKRGLLDVIGVDTNLVVAGTQVELGEEPGAM
jgi:hypothetical protein